MIDTEEKLKEFIPILHAATWVAVDTEADSLHAYPEKVCLIQISTHSSDRLVDPLAGLNLDPLLDALSGHELIMHGADYDLRLLRKHHEFIPSSIFDTMLAARLLGLRQFSLSYLVETYLQVKLQKGSQKANWALRPLTERMEHYARNDTRYLKPLADKLREELNHKGRLKWHQESCVRLVTESARERLPDLDSVWRLKGSYQLGRPALAILRELWQWRESEAIALNRPPFFVISPEALIQIAAASATSRPIEPHLPRHLSDRRKSAILKAIQIGLGLSPDQHPKIRSIVSRRPSEGERRRFLELQKLRDSQAGKLGMDPTLIASRATLSDLAHNWEKHEGDLMDWQRQLLSGDC